MNPRLLVIAFLTAWPPVVAAAQARGSSGNLRGRVTDSRTGAPIAGATVAAIQSQRWGRVATDSSGYYLLDAVPPGTWPVEFHCPSRTFLGTPLGTRTVTIPSGGEAVLNLAVPPGTCNEPEPAFSVRRGIFRGHYSRGFEESRFIPCPDSASGIGPSLLRTEPNASAWLEFTERAWRGGQWPKVPTASERYARYFIVFRGSLEGPGRYGHEGVSEYGLMVDSVVIIRAPMPDDCSVPSRPPQN